MNISIRQLSAFISVADNGSFTRASEQMHLTQSAVSGLIKELESSLGIVLFDRTTRQLSLSVVGHHLLPQARRILNEMQLFENEASSLQVWRKDKSDLRCRNLLPPPCQPLLLNLLKHIQISACLYLIAQQKMF